MVVSKGLKVPNSKKEDAPKKKRPRRKRALWRKHPKPEFPPQGGEARICLTLFLAMLMSVMSAVTMIYATVIVYKPAMKILRANLTGPKRCVTLSTQRCTTHSHQINRKISFGIINGYLFFQKP